jgi:hypothetical protein
LANALRRSVESAAGSGISGHPVPRELIFNVAQRMMPLMDESRRPARKEPDSRRSALLGFLVALLLIVLGLILVRVLGNAGRLQDCVMSGRTNCAPIDTTTPGE